jgi:DNA-binding response OmpR family regulator
MNATTVPRVIIPEDESLIALDVKDELQDAGYCPAIFPDNASAQVWLENDTPDIAVLDVHLTDGQCTEVAQILNMRGVPFLLFTGVPREDCATVPVFSNAPLIGKPAPPGEIARAVGQLVRRRHSRHYLL